MKAGKVIEAAYATFSQYGDEVYAKTKANSFVYRCGVRGNDPEQEVSTETIKNIVYAMLDEDSEKVFWTHLNK